MTATPSERIQPEARPAWAAGLAALGPWLLCAGLTLAVYGSSLRAGLMFDAALDLPRATDRSWLEVLTSAGASPYFRPVTLLLWKAVYALLGRDFAAFHALSLAAHTVCGWLVYQLGRRWAGGRVGLVAAALFLWFPFSYQVVAFIDSLFHSVAALWVLAAAVLYWDARLERRRVKLWASLACGALALFTHESTAILLPPAVAAIETRLAGRRWSWPPLLFGFEALAFFSIWLVVPRWTSTLHVDSPSVLLNGAYFAQGTAYPITMLLSALPRLPMGNAAQVAVTAGAVLAAVVLLAHRQGRLATALWALLWTGCALLPAWLLLPWPNYVIDAPRLLYVAAAGICLMWAAALTPAGAPAAVLAGVLAIAAVLGQSWSFLGIRERLLDRGAAVVEDVVRTAAAPGPEAGRLYVNVPAFLGPRSEEFLLGHFGITMLPDYFGLDLDVAAATGRRLPVASVAYDDLARPWDAAYGFQGRHATREQLAAAMSRGGGVYVEHYDPGRLHLEYAGRVDLGAAPSGPPLARFGDWADLLRVSAARTPDGVRVRLLWRALASAPADYTVFVHLVGDGPRPLAQSDGYPVAGLLAPRDWPPGYVIEDVRDIPLAADLRPAVHRALIGLYDRAAPDHRAPAAGASGAPLPDGAVATLVSD